MDWQRTFWPDAAERRVLGRFYLAGGISEALNVILPFQFIYLYLVMARPEWAVIPLVVESAVILVMEIPTGILADRWGRKRSVIVGDSLSALGWLLIPAAVALPGEAQLLAVCGCFLLEGTGQTLVSGAEDAWVVDNLRSRDSSGLIDRYFARIRSVGSLGGVVAGGIALAVLIGTQIQATTLNLLWYIAAAGQLAAVAIAATIPEHTVSDDGDTRPADLPAGSLQGLRALLRVRPLSTFLLVMVIAAFASSVIDDAFGISLVTKGMDARVFAPLEIIDDLFGIVSPLLGVALARRLGVSRTLTLLLIVPAVAVLLLLGHPGVWWVLGLYLLFNIIEDLWDPVADAYLHSMIPSATRATLGSAVNQATSVASITGLGLFAWLLGEHSEELQAATPGLVEAFTGGAEAPAGVPVVLGLPLPDLALVLFTLLGMLAIPLLWPSRRSRDRTELS